MTVRISGPHASIEQSDVGGSDMSRRPNPAMSPVVIRIPLAQVGAGPTRDRPRSCVRCGSRSFHLHQQAWRTVRDPHLMRVRVARYVCRHCGATQRLYPVGIGAERQTAAVKQMCALLYCMGLTYRAVQQVMLHLGCSLSLATIRSDVMQACGRDQTMRPLSRLRLSHVGPGAFSGPDGVLIARLIGTLPSCRWLELEILERPDSPELEWRAWECAEHFSRRAEVTAN